MIIEAVPNFSEGRRPEVGEALAAAARKAGVAVLDITRDPDHHRCVLTFAGGPRAVEEAAFAVARKALELIDLTKHQGAHPRMGAIDVLPFVPLREATMADAVAMARSVGARIGSELSLPVYLYEAAATRPERRNLADVRGPEFEGLREAVGRDPERTPDFGPNRIHPTGGCVAVGARAPLIAFNIDLDTEDLSIAKRIAGKIRERDGGLPGIKALGIALPSRNCAQVSMNLCDYTKTGLLAVFAAVEREAVLLGTRVRAGELIGLVPKAAFPEDGARALKLLEFNPDRILESRLPVSLEAVRALLAPARSIVVLTGAGISAESGVPTFRGPGGLWRDYRAEDLATPEAFANDPRLVWEWYDWRRQKIAPAKPNPGHYALVTLEKRAPDLTLITQNVDGLHPLAGSRNLLEIHGSLWRTRCLSCRELRENREAPLARIPPRCACEGLLRPDVVWFGEPLPHDLLKRALRAVESCDLMLVIGTSGLVQPAASMADAALARGMPVVEINLDPTPLSNRATYALHGKAGEILPKLIA